MQIKSVVTVGSRHLKLKKLKFLFINCEEHIRGFMAFYVCQHSTVLKLTKLSLVGMQLPENI